ncbi:MAG: glutamate-5-semialdehyde dehydrogenase [Andreesenia angusta]|nr:glutamate-5-semialdehyde dehydrogenase [Andreesenia angusta]
MNDIKEIGKRAKSCSAEIAKLTTNEKNEALLRACKKLKAKSEEIINANNKDIEEAKKNGISGALLDRLILDESRINDMSDGLADIAKLDDPVGEVLSIKTIPNGLDVGQKRVPIGVIGIIYEARPNVTVDGFGLSLKTGNTVILKGGKEAINSNIAIVDILREALKESGIPEDMVQLIKNTDRESTTELMKMDEYLDLLIPRGGQGLIKAVVHNSTVPVIETGAGNCHIFIDASADRDRILPIIINAKAQRPGVCNAVEHILIHKDILEEIAESVYKGLRENDVEVRADKRFRKIVAEAKEAVEEDWETEYLDYIISIKTVDSVEEAIDHINKYSTKHSESILTESYRNSQKFLDEVDSAAVYINASTRFTDGSQFGFGAEIGISTQKLHARGPMGLKELTTTKYIIYGNGQIRE